MFEALTDPSQLALVVAVFATVVSMFACLYVWISDNKQYLDAENINDSIRRMEGRLERLAVRDNFVQELYHLLAMRDKIEQRGHNEVAARNYMLLMFDHLYRAYSDWSDGLLGQTDFGRRITQFAVFWYPQSNLCNRDAQSWWDELAPCFQDAGYAHFIQEIIAIAEKYDQAHEDSYAEILYQTTGLLKSLAGGNHLAPVNGHKNEIAELDKQLGNNNSSHEETKINGEEKLEDQILSTSWGSNGTSFPANIRLV